MTWGERDDLWIGTDRGLVHWNDGRARHFTWNDERRDRVTAALRHRGVLFLGSHAGLLAIPVDAASQASDSADLERRGTRCGVLDGLPDAQITAAAVHGSQVWVGTPAGLVQLE
jgi:ligand-binding sensor domain-containing protein